MYYECDKTFSTASQHRSRWACVLSCAGESLPGSMACSPRCAPAARSCASEGGDTVTSMEVARCSFSTDMMMEASEGT